MKKLFGEGGFVGFLSRHCEKMVFGLAVLVVIWVALPDRDRAPLDESQMGPEVLSQKVKNAQAHLRIDSWPTIEEEINAGHNEYFEKTKDDLKRVALEGYPAGVPFNKPHFPQDRIRTDPELYPVEHLMAKVVHGPITISDPDARGGGRPPVVVGDDDEVRPLPPETQKLVEQFGGGLGAGKIQGQTIVAIRGIVPVRKQRLAFESALADTAGYNSARDDNPTYGAWIEAREEDDPKLNVYGMDYFLVERAEVGPDGQNGEFTDRWGSLKYRRGSRSAVFAQQQWGGGAGMARSGAGSGGEDFPASAYVDEQKFTMAVPPLVLRDLRPIANHPDIKTARQVREESEARNDTGPIELGGDGGDDGHGGDVKPPPVEGPPPIRHGGGHNGGPEGSYSGNSQMNQDVDELLFRFYDLDAQPGKSYVYRVKLLVQDPNFPKQSKKSTSESMTRPEDRTLESSVRERLRNRANPEIYWRETPVAQTGVVRIPEPEQILAGPVDPGRVSHGIRLAEPSVLTMVKDWDAEKALDVPGIIPAWRGSVLNFSAKDVESAADVYKPLKLRKRKVEAIDPTQNALRYLPDHEFQTDAMVLDIRGGEPIPGQKDLSAPGEVLLMDDKGNLIVHSELQDAGTFNDFDFPAPPPEVSGEGENPLNTDGGPPDGRHNPRRGHGGEDDNILLRDSSRPRR